MNSGRVKKIWMFWAMQVLLLCCCLLSQAQTVKTFIDRQDILIGEQLQYKVVATFTPGVFNVHWLNVPDSMPHFDLVDKSKIDTSTENGNTVLQQTLILTSFDSGRWSTPAFVVNFDPVKDDTTVNIATDSFTVNVGYAPADSSNQLRDIKPILDVTIKDYLWYYIGGAVLIEALTAFFLWRYFKNRKKKPAPVFKGKLSPYDEAMQELDKLKAMNLQRQDEVKWYHSKLSDIFKWYISRKQQLSIMNKTTGDVLVHLSNGHLPPDTIATAAAALRTGDAVKFAKYIPGEAESAAAMEKIKTVISFIHTSSGNPQQTVNSKQ